MDLLGALDTQSEAEREWWREWVWEQQQTSEPISCSELWPQTLTTISALMHRGRIGIRISTGNVHDGWYSISPRRYCVPCSSKCGKFIWYSPCEFWSNPALYFQDAGLSSSSLKHDAPHLIMTYCALLLLAMLRDDFSRLDRPGLIKFLRTCQKPDGSFSTVPGDTESDLRTLYCAFAISTMLDDWSGIDVERALTFVESCRVRISLSTSPVG